MNEPRKILVPLDLSDRSRAGVAYAAMLAKGLGSSLVLATNVNMPELAAIQEYADDKGVDSEQAGDQLLMQLADELAPGVEVDTAFSFNDFPAEGILALAEQHGVDMIVIASHGRSGMSRWLLGSVAEKVARGAEIPVVIVPVRES